MEGEVGNGLKSVLPAYDAAWNLMAQLQCMYACN